MCWFVFEDIISNKYLLFYSDMHGKSSSSEITWIFIPDWCPKDAFRICVHFSEYEILEIII